jgi:hypothetical protein
MDVFLISFVNYYGCLLNFFLIIQKTGCFIMDVFLIINYLLIIMDVFLIINLFFTMDVFLICFFV